MKKMLPRLLLATLLAVPAHVTYGFQLFDAAHRVDPTRRSYTYYVSSTFYDFMADDNVAITDAHIEGVKASLAILKDKASAAGIELQFDYGGTYDIADAQIGSSTGSYGTFDFDGKIYFDFTSNELWGRQSVPSATADARSPTPDAGPVTGGVVRLNSDFLNFLHPDGNMASTITHETMHIFGIDHSTISSSNMAYTEFWYPTLSADDIMALRQIFNVGSGTQLTATITKGDGVAGGVEMALVDTTTGVAYAVMTDALGVATIKHVPAGTYKIGVRELTPTGPCFDDPTRGFLATFYRVGQSPTNDPAAASDVTLAADQPLAIAIPLIVGTKKFDCHYGRITAWSDKACNANSFGANTFEEKCWFHMAKPGSRFTPFVENDLSIFHHHTDTSKDETSHSNLAISPLGSQSGLIVHAATIDPELNQVLRTDLEVTETAAAGVHAAVCTDGSEYALMTSMIEVQDFGSSLTNQKLLPGQSSTLEKHRTFRNYGPFLRDGDARPGSGPRPANDAEVWRQVSQNGYGGSITSPNADTGEEETKKKKQFWQCGTIGTSLPTAHGWTLLILGLPLGLAWTRPCRRRP